MLQRPFASLGRNLHCWAMTPMLGRVTPTLHQRLGWVKQWLLLIGGLRGRAEVERSSSLAAPVDHLES